jgi:hypothetical protein
MEKEIKTCREGKTRKKCCVKRAGTRCLGRISSQTAGAKARRQERASNAGTTARRNKDIGKKDY